jgi:mono/diheme cytochrome c family protein
MIRLTGFGFVAALLLAGCDVSTETGTTSDAAQDPVARGRYLVSFAGCMDCHTPGYFFGMPDMSRNLGGSEVGFEIPGLGVFYGPNLTPDPETGLGNWSEEQIVTAITTGKRPDGRELAPAMPWRGFANLTSQDAMAIAAYVKSLPAVVNKVPGPFGPNETPTSFVMRIVPPPGAAPAGAPSAPATP